MQRVNMHFFGSDESKERWVIGSFLLMDCFSIGVEADFGAQSSL